MLTLKEYFKKKGRLQQQQFDEQKKKYGKGNLFRGVVVWITGRTHPSASILRSLILQNGGKYLMKYSSSEVTHIIATQLSYQHQIQFEKRIVVHPNWIIDSIKYGTLQAITNYNPQKMNKKQKQLSDLECTDPNFLDKYYLSSRLHHISLWKTIFSDFLSEKVEGIKSNYSKIMHVDIDSFFVSITISKHSELKGKPVVISHGGNNADVSCCNYEARKYGIKNGMWLKQAYNLCPQLVVVGYDFDEYEKTALKMYEILTKYFNNIEVLSCDECIIDISSVPDPIDTFLQQVRTEIKEAIHSGVSFGIGINPLTARLAMKKAKPDGIYYLLTNIEEFISTLKIEELPGFGYSLSEKCKMIGVYTCGDISLTSKEVLEKQIGEKNTIKLIEMSKGVDNTQFGNKKEKKNIGISINWGIRFENDDDVKQFIFRMCCEVEKRLHKANSITICETQNAAILNKSAVILWNQFQILIKDLRGISIQISKLHSIQPVQIKESKIFQQILLAKQQEEKYKKIKQNEKNKFIELPSASQIDISVLNALPNDVKNELIQHYSKYYNIYNNPKISFANDEIIIEKLDERIEEIELFEIENTKELINILITYLKSRKEINFFHIEIILQYLKVLLKHQCYKEFQIIIKTVLLSLEHPRFNDFKEILEHYAEKMYNDSFSKFLHSFSHQ
ncbi:DNA polymerase IV, putative [Entamoeba dispar SAW760]|uniref:DNA polymerase IV, putative n=1 Tax=Entamoeba dispar (strain ATCC PRA-260 / SAW760) TaxID=370354 RepID=B0ENT0_ENTDS|nr:DNA polymerase IV, putative [Entamoeba dispar SAW760]EDR23817.1 DNA polymerase IV, putative [Entamoeba dispar SAW760]|eukprot:EDR23817.1 DNA polymerase IV, putative [Entamoeba dispar SAW760]